MIVVIAALVGNLPYLATPRHGGAGFAVHDRRASGPAGLAAENRYESVWAGFNGRNTSNSPVRRLPG